MSRIPKPEPVSAVMLVTVVLLASLNRTAGTGLFRMGTRPGLNEYVFRFIASTVFPGDVI